MGRFCWSDGWMVCWLLEKSVENFQTKMTTGAYCAPALALLPSLKIGFPVELYSLNYHNFRKEQVIMKLV